ncbi:MAG: hypothetical protein J7J42_07570 [Thermoplasmata archaeon]|nr:hypothetical protein [Thermoplasmata archaeon]
MKMKEKKEKYEEYIGKTYDDPKKMLEALKKFELKISDIIILLLGITEDNSPIYGRTLLVKEVFLAIQEVFSKYPIKYQDPIFVPYKYGPYSFNLIDTVETMAMQGYIIRRGKRGTRKEMFLLTKKGKKIYEEVKKKLENKYPGLFEELKRKRVGWDELGTDGILKYVYQNYQRYLDKSKIYKKYEPIQWGKGRG